MNTGLVHRKRALQAIKEIDAFPKVPESYQETTARGGGLSIVVFLVIAVLIVSEVRYYTSTELKYTYAVDMDYNVKMNMDIDMTVAMPCQNIGADVLDMTGQSVHSHDSKLVEEDVHFELSPRQRNFFDMVQNINGYIKEEYHAIHDVLWKTGFDGISRNKPQREDSPTGKKDGCRLHGSLAVKKVAGNFHITAGKIKVQAFGSDSHAHLALGIKDKDYNFSHRIDRFSFGDYVPGLINPLDGEEKTTDDNYHMFQYFIQVVPTDVDTRMSKVDTYQYAVTERNRTINHSEGSHGVPGIFVKYDLSALKVRVKEEHRPYWKFIVTLCGIIGGIIQVSGILHGLTGCFIDAICCRWFTSRKSPQNIPPMANPLHSGSDYMVTSGNSSQPDPSPGVYQNSGMNTYVTPPPVPEFGGMQQNSDMQQIGLVSQNSTLPQMSSMSQSTDLPQMDDDNARTPLLS